jgi:toxin ParE1/3/4
VITSYKLSRAAETSLAELVVYSDATFGTMQTAAYVAGMEASFNLLVSFPRIGSASFEIKAGLRRYRYQSHYICYTEQGDTLLIEDLIHVRRNLRRDLFDT